MKTATRISFILLHFLWFANANANVHLSVLFQSNMVLQRDKPCAIWGTADRGENIRLSFNGNTYQTVAAKDGKWKIVLPAQAAGGPYELMLAGKNTIALHNVLFGDVWICGGQSNMEFKVRQLANNQPDSVGNNTSIRIFTAGIDKDYTPHDTLKSGNWQEATVQNLQNFSAVGFFFGKYIEEHIGVPIGLISDNLGGTAVEEWMSKEAIHQFPQFNSYYNQYLATNKSFAQMNADFANNKADFDKEIYADNDPGLQQQWYNNNTDTSDWKPMMLPAYWENAGLPGYDGSVWFKKTFNLPQNYNHKGFYINLGEIDDYNKVWVNGVPVGETYGNLNLREYTIPDSVLVDKNNLITVRVFDAGNKGGMYNFYWYTALAGRWIYKPGIKINASHFTKPLLPNTDTYNSPTILYNANIAPLTNLAIKGVIWYQGEANAGRAEEYKQLFPGLITDWRKQFKQGDFPFLFVQLANWQPELPQPFNSDWAELREAQASALLLPNTGMASAIDIGEAADIHPKNKQEVGRRLALAALKVTYGKDSTHTHPMFQNMSIIKDSIVVTVSDDIFTNDKYGYVRGFSIAGADSVFHWANAYLKNKNEVVVYSRDVHQPIAVRYAWASNPGTLNLYNKEGLPLVPFRTDAWRGVTAGKQFSYVE